MIIFNKWLILHNNIYQTEWVLDIVSPTDKSIHFPSTVEKKCSSKVSSRKIIEFLNGRIGIGRKKMLERFVVKPISRRSIHQMIFKLIFVDVMRARDQKRGSVFLIIYFFKRPLFLLLLTFRLAVITSETTWLPNAKWHSPKELVEV